MEVGEPMWNDAMRGGSWVRLICRRKCGLAPRARAERGGGEKISGKMVKDKKAGSTLKFKTPDQAQTKLLY